MLVKRLINIIKGGGLTLTKSDNYNNLNDRQKSVIDKAQDTLRDFIEDCNDIKTLDKNDYTKFYELLNRLQKNRNVSSLFDEEFIQLNANKPLDKKIMINQIIRNTNTSKGNEDNEDDENSSEVNNNFDNKQKTFKTTKKNYHAGQILKVKNSENIQPGKYIVDNKHIAHKVVEKLQ